MRFGSFRGALALVALAGALAGCADVMSQPQSGRLVVHLTDAPFPFDSVSSVDVFVVRVDARRDDATEADAAAVGDEAQAESNGWITLTEPMQTLDLLSLRGGTLAMIGEAELAAGSYRALRIVIDPSQSSLTLRNGTVLDGGHGVAFPSGSRSGIKVQLAHPVQIEKNQTSSVVIDFDVGKSFVMRGSSIAANGLLFKPVIKGIEQ